MVGRRGIVAILFFFCSYFLILRGEEMSGDGLGVGCGGGWGGLFCWGVQGRIRNGQVGAERVWDGRAERDRIYFVLLEKFCFENFDFVFLEK